MKIQVTESMISVALDEGNKRGIFAGQPPNDAIKAMLSAAFTLLSTRALKPSFDFEVVGPTRKRERARFVAIGTSRGYFQVETESGKILNIHANEIFATNYQR